MPQQAKTTLESNADMRPRRELPKAYDPAAIEERWAAYWVEQRLFEVKTPVGSHERAFTVLLPPPNVTGNLHMGHMFEHTESDILVRWHRMLGETTLWLPGTDHAGIATQMLVERLLVSESTSRQALGREAFVERVRQWRRYYGGAILASMKRIGDTVDWSREYYTMDDNLSVAVREAFVRLYEDGLIYRGAYIVNWCPRCQTAISDLEVTHEEQQGKLWEIRYPVVGAPGEFLTVATTRPETMLGDVAVAVNPLDERYTHLHGKTLKLPLTDREIPVIVDDWVKSDFGTGAVKVTPAHDPNDFAIGQRHNLPAISVMDEAAHMTAEAGPAYSGLDRYDARKKVLEDLDSQGLLGAVRDHVNAIGKCARCQAIVEPRLSTQWFVAVNKTPNKGGDSMAEMARKVAQPDASGKKPIRFTPENYEKIYLEWMNNIYDWCISRQLWWGHRIPAWHCATCGKITVARVDPTACAHCGSAQITQETDVLDTWFSSGLLPVSVFGWPNFGATNVPQILRAPSIPLPSAEWVGDHEPPQPTNRADFDAFYPTSLLVTGFDILFFWVARMIMLGIWFAQDIPEEDGSPRTLAESVPFREVYIHALVRDANREKMSKTKGNVIDPIEIVKTYGTDAVRFTLASMASPGTDIAFNIARTEGYRAFANKIWNAARFLFQNLEKANEIGVRVSVGTISRSAFLLNEWPTEELWILSRLNRTAHDVSLALDRYRFDDAANLIYQFFWSEFCDWYLEFVKFRLDFNETANKNATGEALATLTYVFESFLRLLSPFMPFISEEIWHSLYDNEPPRKSIALAVYPLYVQPAEFDQITFNSAEAAMQILQRTIIALRARRKELDVDEKSLVNAKITAGTPAAGVIKKHLSIIKKLAKIDDLEIVFFSERERGKFADLAWQSAGPIDLFVEHEKQIDVPAERDRLTKDIAKYEKGLAAAERQLGNEGFLAKAPAHIVEGLKKQEAETRLLLEKARAALDALPPEA